MEYYNRLKDTRIDADKTQKETAKLLNIKQQQYSEYERGLRLMPINYLTKFCEVFNISSDYILGLPKNSNYPRETKSKKNVNINISM